MVGAVCMCLVIPVQTGKFDLALTSLIVHAGKHAGHKGCVSIGEGKGS